MASTSTVLRTSFHFVLYIIKIGQRRFETNAPGGSLDAVKGGQIGYLLFRICTGLGGAGPRNPHSRRKSLRRAWRKCHENTSRDMVRNVTLEQGCRGKIGVIQKAACCLVILRLSESVRGVEAEVDLICAFAERRYEGPASGNAHPFCSGIRRDAHFADALKT